MMPHGGQSYFSGVRERMKIQWKCVPCQKKREWKACPFQSSFTNLGRTNRPPVEWFQTWKDQHPQWTYRLWTNRDLHQEFGVIETTWPAT